MLDAGRGPGTITLGLARAVAPGHVIGIDVEDSQFEQAQAEARRKGLSVGFRKGSVYELPFEAQQSDAVFSHAVLEHLSDPAAAIAEFRRVLKPGGVIGLRAGAHIFVSGLRSFRCEVMPEHRGKPSFPELQFPGTR